LDCQAQRNEGRMPAFSEVEAQQLEAARVVLKKMAAGDPTMTALVAGAELFLSRHGQTSPPAPARPRCQLTRAETCCACGLLADPGHQPAGSADIFCAGCCIACRLERPGQAELFGEIETKR